MDRKLELDLVMAVINDITANLVKSEIKSNPIRLEDIDFNQVDVVDATKVNCINFRSKGDLRYVGDKALNLNFGNMVSGYAFEINGIQFLNSETAYISGIYSNNNSICQKAQSILADSNNGLWAKKEFRYWDNIYTSNARTNDWETFNISWMMYIVWQKVIQNEKFRNMLLATPDDSLIIEDTSFQSIKRSPAKLVWGSENIEIMKLKKGKLKELSLRLSELNIPMKKKHKQLLFNSIYNIGTFEGQNLMGKILTYFRICLRTGKEPNIDYNLLKSKNIYLNRQKLVF